MKFNASEIYLEQYSDVRSAVDTGGVASALEHYLLYGRKEGRSWPEIGGDPAPGAEATAVVGPSPDFSQVCEDVRIARDLVFVGGWVDDRCDLLVGLTLIVGDQIVALHVGRCSRADVAEHLAAVSQYEFGYWAVGCLERPTLFDAPKLRILLASGRQAEATPERVTRFAPNDLPDSVLADFAARCPSTLAR